MGLGSFLLGGTKTHTFNPTNPEGAQIGRDVIGYGNSQGVGKGGRYVKGILNELERTRSFDSLPEVAYAQARGAANWSDLKRQVEMSSSANGSQVPQASLLAKYLLQNQDQTGQASVSAAANAVQGYLGAFQNALNSQRETRLRAYDIGARQFQPLQMYQTQSKGLLGGLASLGGLISPIAGAIGGIASGLGRSSAAPPQSTTIAANPVGIPGSAPVGTGFSGSLNLGQAPMPDQYRKALSSRLF